MNKQDLKLKFLQQLEDMINEIVNIFPDNKKIVSLREKYLMLKKANSKIIIDTFISSVLIHKEKILTKDESFFLDGGYQDDISEDHKIRYVSFIKDVWLNQMTNENKEIVWQYFKVLVILSEKYSLFN